LTLTFQDWEVPDGSVWCGAVQDSRCHQNPHSEQTQQKVYSHCFACSTVGKLTSLGIPENLEIYWSDTQAKHKIEKARYRHSP